MDPLARFDDFVREVRARLDAGRVAYGDRSFERAPAELVQELRQEALDLAGWAFVLCVRLEGLEVKAAGLETADPPNVLRGADADRLLTELANHCGPEEAVRWTTRARETRAEMMRPKGDDHADR